MADAASAGGPPLLLVCSLSRREFGSWLGSLVARLQPRIPAQRCLLITTTPGTDLRLAAAATQAGLAIQANPLPCLCCPPPDIAPRLRSLAPGEQDLLLIEAPPSVLTWLQVDLRRAGWADALTTVVIRPASAPAGGWGPDALADFVEGFEASDALIARINRSP